ncbi:tumor necrosis factor receptor superfamily member 10A-like [Anolis sagrei]|uniref:tumor necrosis factor receptor superfamily member 10A-like n=1 Tax=Anolis sagrei TaxID=38937 RepID=UPI00352136E4
MGTRLQSLLLLLLLLALCLQCGVSGVAIVRSPEDSPPAALGEAEESSEFYLHEGQRCQKCPPGSRVDQHCTSDNKTTCHPCNTDTFSKHSNALPKCFSCKTCRRLDEVELQPCTTTSDTECACKNGTFCLPSFPCETCHKCTPRCPEGEQVVRPCTPTSDIECAPYTTSPSPPTGRSHEVATWTLIGLLLLLLLFVVPGMCWKFGCCNGAKARGVTAVLWRSKTLQCLQRNCSQGRHEEGDNLRNMRRESRPPLQSCAPPSPKPLEMTPLQAAAPPGEESHGCAAERKRHLLPVKGKDPLEALRESFYTFINEVPPEYWFRYVRALGLSEFDICAAEQNNKGLYERRFQMLRTWLDRRGKEASLETLLETLCGIELRGVEDTVRERLVSQKIYVFEEDLCL